MTQVTTNAAKYESVSFDGAAGVLLPVFMKVWQILPLPCFNFQLYRQRCWLCAGISPSGQ